MGQMGTMFLLIMRLARSTMHELALQSHLQDRQTNKLRNMKLNSQLTYAMTLPF